MSDEGVSPTPALDPAALVAEFETRWSTDGFHSWSGKPLVRLADSEYGQPDTQGRNPYWDIIRQFPLDDLHYPWGCHVAGVSATPGLERCRPHIVTRHDLVWTYAWGIPTPADLRWIVQHLAGRSVVEIGAGTGYWAWQLSQLDVDVLAFDIRTGKDDNPWCRPIQYHPVHRGGPEKAGEHPTRALLLCWPPHHNPMAADALRAYGGDLVVYVGDSRDGCCADDEFFMLLDKDWDEIGMSPHHVTYGDIQCYLMAYRRKEVQR